MTVIVTLEGDHLDHLVAAHYGAANVARAMGEVLSANLGLAALGPTPPAGTRVVLPDLAPAAPQIRLWD